MAANGKEPDGKAPEDDVVPIEVAAPAAAEAPRPADPVAVLEAKLEALEKEKKETYERMLRTAADFDNFRKRSRKEGAEAEARGRTALAKELLPAIDNLERATAHEGADAAAVLEGVRLVLKQMQSTLDRFEVRPFEAVGAPFDPALHEAIQQIETDQHPAGTVVSQFQKGYRIGEKLLRPAMVVVAKPKPTAATEGQGISGAGQGASGAGGDEGDPQGAA
jgi:molecular chaperone GrpE